jgi:CBS domain-containing protein
MTIGKVFKREVMTALGEETVLDAARRMQEKGVGALVVVDPHRMPVGIVTDRDIAMKAVAGQKDPRSTPVREVMSPKVVVMDQDRGIFDAARTMQEQGIRRIPVVDGKGRLIGIVCLDDILMLLGQEMASLGGTIAYGTVGAAGGK